MAYFLIFCIVVLACVAAMIFGGFILLKRIWYKMHELVGIDPRPGRYAPHQRAHGLDYQPNTPFNPTLNQSQTLKGERDFAYAQQTTNPTVKNSKYWQVKHGKITPLTHLTGIHRENLNEMPSEALVILSRINDKLARYNVWRQELGNINDNETWLTEKQFAINRLTNESIPEAINHYDQLARFDPHRVNHTKIAGEMTASDMLIEVLQDVDGQLDSLIDELYQQTVHKLASTHRYVKSRIE